MKRVLSMLLAIIMVLGMVPVTAFAVDTARISFEVDGFDPETATVGTTFTVKAYLEKNPGIAAFTNSLTWNEDVVKITKFTRSSAFFADEEDPWDAATVEKTTGKIAAARSSNVSTNGLLYTVTFEIIAENGSLDLGLLTEDYGDTVVFMFHDIDGKKQDVELDTSAISDLSFGGPAIPEGAPFTIITTDDGFPLSIEYVEDVEFNYSYVPYYVVTVSDNATKAYITAPDQYLEEDLRDQKYYAMGYAANLNNWSAVYPRYDYEETAAGPKVIVPFEMVGSDMGGNSVSMRFLSAWDAEATHAFGIEDSTTACLGLISFQQKVETYAIKTDDTLEGGRVWAANKDGDVITEAAQDDEVYVHYEAAEGYKMKNIGYYHDGEFYHTENAIFNMPDGEVTMSGKFEPIHTCAYTEEVVDPNYLKSDATCTSGAVYYKSCTCNKFESGETAATFTSGEPVDCVYVDGKCQWCEKSEPSAAPELVIPEGAPFTDITTDVGSAISVTKQEEDLTIYVYGYEEHTAPLYSVVIPEGATKTYVTLKHPINELTYGIGADGKPINVSGYYGNVVYDEDASADVGENGGYTSFEFTSPDDRSTTITVPMKLKGNYSLVKPADYDEYYDEEYDEYYGPAYYAAAPEDSNYDPICFFTFEYGTAAGGSEPEACTHPNAADDGDCETAVTCPDCKVVVTAAQIHSFTNYVSNNDATCEADGTKTAKCDHEGCEETHYMNDEGSKLGHSFTNYVSDGNATCKVDGTKTATCDREGCEQQSSILDEGSKLPHTYTAERATEQYLKSAATCTQKAVYYKSCADCGLKGSETFESGEKDSSNHNFEGGVCTRCETPDPNAPVEPENPETIALTAAMTDGTVLPVEDLGEQVAPDGLSYPFYEITVPEGTVDGTPLVLTYNGTNIEYIYNYGVQAPTVPMVFNYPDCPNMIILGIVDEFTAKYVAGFYIVQGDITTEPDNGDDPACGHTETTTAYVTVSGEKHTVTVTCQCGEQISQTTENCVDNDNDRACDLCSGAVACKHINTTTNTTKTQVAGTETHTITVTCSCGDKISEITEDCVDEAKDGTCDVCGGAVEVPVVTEPTVIFDSSVQGAWGTITISKLLVDGVTVKSYEWKSDTCIVTLAADTPKDAAITFSYEGLSGGGGSGAVYINGNMSLRTVNLVDGAAEVKVRTASKYSSTSQAKEKTISFQLEGTAFVPVESIVITPENPKVIANGGKLQLVANVYPENATIKDVVWNTTAASTAITLSETGQVMGQTMGMGQYYTITATSVSNPEVKASTRVFLDYKMETAISISQETMALQVGETGSLSASVTADQFAGNTTVTWSSSDESVATVANGKVTGLKNGTATITATSYHGLTATCEVTVEGGSPECDHEGTQTTTDYTQVEGEEKHAVTVKCVCGAQIGETTYADCVDSNKDRKCDTCAGTVKVPVTELKWWSRKDSGDEVITEITVQIDDVVDAVAGCTPRNTAGNVITFTSADPEIVTVNTAEAIADEYGHAYTNFTANKAGQTTVTAASNDNAEVKAVLTVHVVCPGHKYVEGECKFCGEKEFIPNPITSITITNSNITVTNEETNEMAMNIVGGSGAQKLRVEIELENAELDATQEITWTSSNSDIAWVEDGYLRTAAVEKTTTVYLTAMAGNKNTPALPMLIDEEEPDPLATIAVTVEPVENGYTVSVPTEKTVVAGEKIEIPVTVNHTGSENFNSYELTFQYDPEKLTLETQSDKTDGKEFTVMDNNGTITVRRYGDPISAGETAGTLEFTAKDIGEFDVQLIGAKVGTSKDAQDRDIPIAQVVDGITQIAVTGYIAKLPDAFRGDIVVKPGAEYTFVAKNENYTYTVKATIDGKEIEVTPNTDGTSFTIAEDLITGDVMIQILTEEGRKFDVSITGEAADDMQPAEGFTTGEEKAQYMVDYKVVLKPDQKYEYTVVIKIGEETYSCTPENNVYTIAGNAITGDIEINVTRKQVSFDVHNVVFEGSGKEDVVDGTAAVQVEHGKAYTFNLLMADGYAYTVTAAMGGTEAVTPVKAETANEDGSYTYTIGNVTADLKIVIEKSDLKVEVNEYVDLDGKTVFLVTATQSVADGKTLAYDGNVMYLKNFKDADDADGMQVMYSYLVEVGINETLKVEDAAAKITVIDGKATDLTDDEYTYNVNESPALDINDAQLVYDMYNNVYQNIDTVGMQKFLRGDVNGDRKIDVGDTAAVVNEILETK